MLLSRIEKYVRGLLWLIVGLSTLGTFIILSNLSADAFMFDDPFLNIPRMAQAIWPMVGLFVVCHSAAVLFGPKEDWRKTLTNSGILFAAVVISLGIMELVARLILPQPRFDPRLPYYPYLNNRVLQNRNGREYETRYTTNEWGLRGDPPPENWEETYTIITIGGSTTQDYFLDDADAWAAILQSNLQEHLDTADIWVGNAGLPGQTTYAHILVMEKMIQNLRPDAVIFLVGANDMAFSLLEEGAELKQGNSADLDRTPLLYDSQLYRLTRRIVYTVGNKETVKYHNYDYFDLTPVEPGTLSPLPNDLREVLPSLENYRDNIETLIDLAEELDIEVLFLTQPMFYSDSEEWEEFYGATMIQGKVVLTINARTYRQFMDIFNQELLAICDERQVACYDLASHMPNGTDYYLDEVHYTKEGAELVAEEVTKAVLENLSIGEEQP